MGSRFKFAVVCAALLPLAASGLGAQARGDTRPGIAVMPFDNGGSYGQGKEDFDALQRGIAGMLISELALNPSARALPHVLRWSTWLRGARSGGSFP